MCSRLELLVLGLLIYQYQKTSSSFQLGLILVFNHLPKSVLSPCCVTLADRFSHRRIVMLAHGFNIAAAAAVICSLIVAGGLKPWHAYLTTAVQGVSRAVQEPARRTAIFDMVRQGWLVNAVSLEQVARGEKLVGPLLGSVLVGLAGYGWAYGVAVAFHVVGLAMLVFMTIPPLARNAVPETIFRGLAEVTGYTLRMPMLLGTLYIIVLMNALGFPVEQSVPTIGKDDLRVGPVLVGLLMSGLAMGQTPGAAMAFMRIGRNHGRLLLLGCLVGLVMGRILAWSTVYALSFAVFSISGWGRPASSPCRVP